MAITDVDQKKNRRDCYLLYRWPVSLPPCHSLSRIRSIEGVANKRQRLHLEYPPAHIYCLSHPYQGLHACSLRRDYVVVSNISVAFKHISETPTPINKTSAHRSRNRTAEIAFGLICSNIVVFPRLYRHFCEVAPYADTAGPQHAINGQTENARAHETRNGRTKREWVQLQERAAGDMKAFASQAKLGDEEAMDVAVDEDSIKKS